MEGIPQEEGPKKDEVYLFTKLSERQKELYKGMLSQVLAAAGELDNSKSNYSYVVQQYRSICNHPYLMTAAGDQNAPDFMVNLIKNSGKMIILDKLLEKFFKEKRQVVIFCEMPNILKILELYCSHKNYKYCMMVGDTSFEKREEQITDFFKLDSDKFLFLLPTGLASPVLPMTDTVIFYDSHWNPNIEDEMLRLHNMEQKNPVTIYRMVTEGTMEERFLEMTKKQMDFYKKSMGWHALGIDEATVVELYKSLIYFGQDEILSEGSDSGTGSEDFAEMDIEEYLEKSKIKTVELNSKFGIVVEKDERED